METHSTSDGLSLKKRVTLLTSFLILLLPMVVVADVCSYEKSVSFTLPVDTIQRLSIRAETGTLAVYALPAQDGSPDEVRVEARVCSARKATLEYMDVVHALKGDVLLLQAVIPEIESAFWINHYPYIDLDIGVPAGLSVTIKDGSGDMQVSGTGALQIDDGSGSITVSGIAGDVRIEDGSGAITVEQVDGAVDIEDGSGAIDVSHVTSGVVVDDGSGELRIAQVGGTVSISDGSGSIDVMDVEQAVTILEDGSGRIEYRNITGDIFQP